MKKLLFIVFVLVTSTSCDKNDIENSTLNGVWIETIHTTDTLVFDNQYTGFILNRGTEIRNDYLLPKYLSGPYMYEIENDSISLRWGASSSSYANKYYFKLLIPFGQASFISSLNGFGDVSTACCISL
jgi:hypothetical protein